MYCKINNLGRIFTIAIFVFMLCGAQGQPIDPAQFDGRIRVACVGDSITFGAGIKDRKTDSYPVQLQRLLGAKKWDVRNFGVSSATMLKKGNYPYWNLKAFKEALAFEPHVVLIKLGTNDSKPDNWKFKSEYSVDYKAMIAAFSSLPSKPQIWLCRPVPVVKDRWGITEVVVKNEVIPLIDGIADSLDLPVIDLHAALSGKAQLFPDGVHPNGVGAGFIAREIYRVLVTPAIRTGEWNGYVKQEFSVGDRQCFLVLPKKAAKGNPWVWRARFWGHEPQTDLALLAQGYHVAYMDVGNLYGGPEAVGLWNQFYEFLVKDHGLGEKPALEGMSRGGLIIFNWAKANPDRVSCIYADAPVCDIRSWPGGKGKGKGSPSDWERCMKVYGLTEETAKTFKGNPIDDLEALAKAGVPLLHICGAADDVVPMEENTNVIESRYKALQGDIKVIAKEGVGHHPHSLKDPAMIVEFITGHVKVK